MESFVIAIISRTNRVTNLAPNKVTKADIPLLVSSRAEQSLKLVRRPKLYADGYTRIANVDIFFCNSETTAAVDEPDATKVTDFAFKETNCEKKQSLKVF